MTSGDTVERTGYPFFRCVRTTSNGTTAVNVMTIPAGIVVTNALAIVVTVAADTHASNITVGDDDTADGFISAADGKATAGTVYGDAPTERGSYLYDSTVKGGYTKYYATAKTVKLVQSHAVTTDGVYDVVITGYRIDPLA